MNDARVVLTVIVLLGAFTIGGLAGTVWLTAVHADQGAVAVISGLTGTALGALAGVLASTKTDADPVVQQVADAAHAQGVAETESAIAKLG